MCFIKFFKQSSLIIVIFQNRILKTFYTNINYTYESIYQPNGIGIEIVN